MKKRKLYMLTTKDEFELPIIVEDNYKDFARRARTTVGSAKSAVCRKLPGYHKVIIEEDE
jgi:hypothetical protein